MAIAIASQTINPPMSAFNNSTTVNVPSGVVNGNLLVLFSSNEGVYAYQTLTGWNALQADTQDSQADCDGLFWYRIASSEPSSYTLKVSGTHQALISAAMFNITGFNASSPIRASGIKGSTSNSTTSAVPATLTGVQSSDLVIIGYGYGGASQTSSAPTMTGPSGWTQLGTSGPTSVSKDYQGAMVMASKVAGTDTPTASANASGGWVVMSIAIAAATATVANDFMPFFGM